MFFKTMKKKPQRDKKADGQKVRWKMTESDKFKGEMLLWEDKESIENDFNPLESKDVSKSHDWMKMTLQQDAASPSLCFNLY